MGETICCTARAADAGVRSLWLWAVLTSDELHRRPLASAATLSPGLLPAGSKKGLVNSANVVAAGEGVLLTRTVVAALRIGTTPLKIGVAGKIVAAGAAAGWSSEALGSSRAGRSAELVGKGLSTDTGLG